MDIDPQEIVDTARSASEGREAPPARLNAAVAVTIAVLATFMGICRVKDDNIVQAMQQAQADKIDHLAFYQARNIREQMAEATLTWPAWPRAMLRLPSPLPCWRSRP